MKTLVNSYKKTAPFKKFKFVFYNLKLIIDFFIKNSIASKHAKISKINKIQRTSSVGQRVCFEIVTPGVKINGLKTERDGSVVAVNQ